MSDISTKVAASAAKLFTRRDRLAADLRRIDAELQEKTVAYSQAVKTWGFTPLMLRHACEARGLLARED